VYCPKCEDVYVPRIKFVDIDGAYFGCSFPHIFLQTFPELMPTTKPTKYVARIYGFKIFGRKGSKYEGHALPTGEEKKEDADKEVANK
jgi:casein kinase II subunit beta